jgi:hypothetical protein
MSEEIMVTEADTETAATETQAKTFSQTEVDRMIADRVSREQRKYEKQLSGIDINEAKQLLSEKQNAEIERQKERGNFEEVLRKTVEKKDAEIKAYQARLQSTLIDGALLSAASAANAYNPEQVSTLLRNHIKLSDDGSVEIIDDNGSPRYNDAGNLLTTNELVSEFLMTNPHHVKAGLQGVGSKGNVGGSSIKTMTPAEMVANWSNGGKEVFAALQKKAK